MPLFKDLLKRIDWLFIVLLFSLLAVNMFILASASSNINSTDSLYYVKKQLLWVAIGTVAMIAVACFNYEHYMKLWPFIFMGCAALLILVLFLPEIENTHRWIDLKFMNFQPSEITKLALIVSLSCFFVQNIKRIKSFGVFIVSGILSFIVFVLILIEPDLGSAMVILAIYLPILWLAGASRKWFVILMLIIILLVGGLYFILYQETDAFTHKVTEPIGKIPLSPYQLNRLIIFIDPYIDPLDTGYHMIQSLVAIGSGGMTGKGYGEGTQVQGNFLPAHHTDFIFAVVGEEFGFWGAAGLLMLYLLLLLRLAWIAFRAKDLLGRLIVVGVVSMLTFQILVNVGMTIGIMPITGITLPFLSYGGSSLLLNMVAMGLVLSVSYRKNDIQMFDEL